jgi:sialic acid synthase SpsE
MRQLFTKSVALKEDLPAGTILRREHLTGKKPGTGIPIARLHEVVNRRLKRAVAADGLLTGDDLE